MKSFFIGIISFLINLTCMAQTTTIVVGAGAGGLTDMAARTVADFLTHKGNKTLVINKPGAGQVIAANFVATQKPADKTLLLGTMSNTVIAPIDKATGAQFDENTLVPVGFIGISPFILVANKNQIASKNFKDFLNEYSDNHNKINFGISGTFSGMAIQDALKSTKKPINLVPYKTSTDILLAVISGSIQVGLIDLGTVYQSLKDNKIVALATTTKTRVSVIPEVISIHELVKDYMFLGAFLAIFASPGTSLEVAESLNSQLLELHRTPEFKERLDKLFLESQPMNQKEFSNFYKKQISNFKSKIN